MRIVRLPWRLVLLLMTCRGESRASHLLQYFTDTSACLIRDFPDHATFRGMGAKLACADKLGVFLSLTLCNKANFDPLQRVKYDGLEKNVKQEKKCMDRPLFPGINLLIMLV